MAKREKKKDYYVFSFWHWVEEVVIWIIIAIIVFGLLAYSIVHLFNS